MYMDFNKYSQAGGGVPVSEMIQILKDLSHNPDLNVKINQIENLRSRVQSPHHAEKLVEIFGALKIPDQIGNGAPVIYPQTGESYPVTNNLIEGYIKELESTEKMSQTFNLQKYAQQVPKKKKTRGNPFRVLMGKIGKLLDHGLERRDIVRYLLKDKVWNQQTIEKAVKVVKDYNKKKHSKQATAMTTVAQTLQIDSEEWPRMKKDYPKRSSAELIASITWLNSLDQMTVEKGRSNLLKDMDKSGVKIMIREIKSELIKRGMSEADLDLIVKKL